MANISQALRQVAVVTAIIHHRVGLSARPADLAPHRRDAIHQRQAYVPSLTFAAVRIIASGTPAVSVIRWCLLPAFRRSTGLGPVFSPVHRTDGSRIDHCSRKVDLVGLAQLRQQPLVDPLPDVGCLPLPQAVVQGHAAATHLLWEILPRCAPTVATAAAGAPCSRRWG